MNNSTHVQEEGVSQADAQLDEAHAYGKASSTRAQDVSDAQGEVKWSSVRGAGDSSVRMQQASGELAGAIKSMAESTAAFRRLVEATHKEFVARDEQGQREMAAKLQEVADLYGSGPVDAGRLAGVVAGLFGASSMQSQAVGQALSQAASQGDDSKA